MIRRLSLCLSTWVAVAAAVPAAAALPAGCREALDALQQEEAATVSRSPSQAEEEWRRAVRVRIEPLQRRAAIACLGGSTAAVPSTARHVVPPPVSVAPVGRPAPPRLPPTATLPAPALPRPTLPPMITACDDSGCLTSDGSRLPRAGAGLVGPRGLCSGMPGMPLQCP